jgi:tetratricopeptide (TPR) repeat protein
LCAFADAQVRFLASSPNKDDRSTASSHAEGEVGNAPLAGVTSAFSRLRAWAYGHWIRSVAIAATILSLIAVTMAGWAYLATVALEAGAVSIEPAFAALDEGRFDEARSNVVQILNSGALPKNEYGGPLYVLGAVKIHDAETQTNPERQRTDYLVASRYLQEAHAYGIPAGREQDGQFKLGQSLVESGQVDEGLRILDEFVTDEKSTDKRLKTTARQLLADTYLFMPQPNAEKALRYNTEIVGSKELTDSESTLAHLRQAECLSRLNRYAEARQSLEPAGANGTHQAAIQVARAKIAINELEAAAQEGAGSTSKSDKSSPELANAIRLLQNAAQHDDQKAEVSRQSSFLLGRAFELGGDPAMAQKQYARTRQLFADSYEGAAATLAEANLLRKNGDFDAAVLGYRRVLESIKAAPLWRSMVLPLPQARQQIMTALKDLVQRHRYQEAQTLIDHLQPLFTQTEQLELRGTTLEKWGTFLLSNAANSATKAAAQRTTGLQRLRAAGLAFEQMAEQRFATPFYTTDLWHSAENYFAGHSFTSTIRLLNKYLDYEPELRNAQALLRLGQAQLAIRKIPESIGAFEECIEFHPVDSASFQARIDCAKAYWYQGNLAKAEQLLRDNIAGSALKPSSREWKDSLFELGMLLHETHQHEKAIATLEEAIERYPSDPQRLSAQYVVGESYRRRGQQLITEAAGTRTASEREKSLQTANSYLDTALKHFEEVQVSITLKAHDLHGDPLLGTMLRNCYMLEGTVLFDLGRFKEAIEAYSNVASLYPDNPFVLETFLQISNCWRRLGQDGKARGAIAQAKIVLESLPKDADFVSTTALNREEWGMLLADMSKW